MSLSILEYLEEGGCRCPFCEKKTAGFKSLDDVVVTEDDVIEVPAQCNAPDCGEEWVDKYRLYGIDSDTEARLEGDQ